MSSDFDPTEFVDSDFKASQKAAYPPAPGTRAPSREEVDSKVGETQQKLAELKRIQEELERERSSLEETRRRQIEYQNGRQEMIQNLTRGVGLLTEAEFAARRDAEQMARSLVDLREALAKVESTSEESWTKENFAVELTRALTVIENARMEWNSARLKFAVLSGTPVEPAPSGAKASPTSMFGGAGFFELCKLGLALTWPVAVVAALAGIALILAVLMRH